MFKGERSGKCEPIIFIFDLVMIHQQTQFLNYCLVTKAKHFAVFVLDRLSPGNCVWVGYREPFGTYQNCRP